jgi:hypothetical protein
MKSATILPRLKAPRRKPRSESECHRAPQTKDRAISCEEAAEILMFADQMLTDRDRTEIAAGIEEARRRMNDERLH